MSYKITYFNGKTSKPFDANLTVGVNSWMFSFVEEGRQKTVSWQFDLIQRPQVLTSDFVSFVYGDTLPFQRLESTDSTFIQYLSENHPWLSRSKDAFLQKFKFGAVFGLLSTIVLVVALVYFYVIPFLSVKFVENLHKDRVVDFGDYVFNHISADLEIDTVKTKQLQRFVDEVDLNDDSFPISVYVAKSDQVNAFAVSGGKIVIYSALLDQLENESQLMALLGHEISHIENRHVLKSVARSLSGAFFASIVFGDANGVATLLADNANMFMTLSYSRELEEEADFYGMQLIEANELNTEGMVGLLEVLKKQDSVNVKYLEYLSTHPDIDKRIEKAKSYEATDGVSNSVLKIAWQKLKE